MQNEFKLEVRRNFEEVRGRLDRVEQTQAEHSVILAGHTATLAEHSAILAEHTALLKEHTALLKEILSRLPAKSKRR